MMDLQELVKELRESAKIYSLEINTRIQAADAIEQLQRELEEARKDASTLKRALILTCTEADEFRAELRIKHPRNPPISESSCITNAKTVLNSIDAARQQKS